ncbi:hypothetical protein D9M71_803450 [compost metagenome]
MQIQGGTYSTDESIHMLDVGLQFHLQPHLHIGQSSYYEYSYHWFEWHAFVQLQVQLKFLVHLQELASLTECSDV